MEKGKMVMLEVTESEAKEILSDRWLGKRWKQAYLPFWICVLLAVLAVVLMGLRDVSDWIVIAAGILILIPGIYFHFKYLTKSLKEAKHQLTQIQEGG